MAYIQNNHPKENGCVFCRCAAMPDGADNLIAARGQAAFVILNRYPYTSGHVMIVPFEHRPSLELLTPSTRAEMMELVAQAIEVLRVVYHPQGFNVGANIGEAAGAGIAEHVHIHIVPRWNGDTNFMSSVAGTRVLPEALGDTWERIKRQWESAPHG